MAGKETPLMKQYKEIKSKYMDSVLFFRLGDFYEMFFDDAKIASRELGLTLTSRNKEKGMEVPLAGVPYHSSTQYIAKLVDKGFKVAICEQVEDPKQAKGIVKRDVTRVITPGTVIDVNQIDEKSNNFLLGIKIEKEGAGIAYLDITTGEFSTTEFKGKDVISKLFNEINKISPREIIVDSVTKQAYFSQIDGFCKFNNILLNEYDADYYENEIEFIKEHFGVVSLSSFGVENKEFAARTSALVLKYVLDLNKDGDLPVNKISYINTEKYMELNIATQRNLELLVNDKQKSDIGTLLWVLDKTKTSMGARLLKKMIKNPLINLEEITKRQEDVEYFIENIIEREEVKEYLKNIYDLERLIGKIILGTENGRDLIAIKKTLYAIKNISQVLEESDIIDISIDDLDGIINLIEKSITEEPPFSIREGGIIKDKYDEELDELRAISTQGKDYILSLEQREKERTGIKSLKVKFNKVFGYYLEVTKNNLSMVPDDYIRKQTLANAERYITPELKEYETKVLNAKDKIEEIEYKLFKDISGEIKSKNILLQDLAVQVAYLDAIISFSTVAINNDYVKPELHLGTEIDITEGRHPIVEALIGEEEYVKNCINLTKEKNFIVLTGPNMAGKSTYMKQTALILLMAQIGSYVPADNAKIGIVDKIFTRVGASDDLVSGQSTFMVEMSEVANIVNNATDRSFIILDEVGRGTSTFDGISIAWAITEYIHDHINAKTIFATHYHELTELERRKKGIVNYRIEVKETDESIVFLRKIVKGGADKSYGIEVAKLAGLPKEILSRSKNLLNKLEKKRDLIEKKIMVQQLSLFDKPEEPVEVQEEKKEEEAILVLREMDINNMTPLEALNKLNELKGIINNGG